ncbi:MAG: HTH domain-containing protein [Paludibacteraceae bacterium]|nr:HTH domain-containing protein [Paludibacteraceae bacterium]
MRVCLTITNFRIISEKISEKVPVSERTIENDLAVLKKYGLIRRIGGRKEGYWQVLI